MKPLPNVVYGMVLLLFCASVSAQSVFLEDGEQAIGFAYGFTSTDIERPVYSYPYGSYVQKHARETSSFSLSAALGGTVDIGITYGTIHESDYDYWGLAVELLAIKDARRDFPLSVGIYSIFQFANDGYGNNMSAVQPGANFYIKAKVSRTVYVIPFLGGGPTFRSNSSDDGQMTLRAGVSISGKNGNRGLAVVTPQISIEDDLTTYGFTVGFAVGI